MLRELEDAMRKHMSLEHVRKTGEFVAGRFAVMDFSSFLVWQVLRRRLEKTQEPRVQDCLPRHEPRLFCQATRACMLMLGL